MRLPFSRQEARTTDAESPRAEPITTEIEERSMFGSPLGWSGAWGDPAAIPPPGLGGMNQYAGVQITLKTALMVDATFTACRIISNAIIKMGCLRAYTEALSDDNIGYRVWEADQPDFLTDTYGYDAGSDVMSYDGMRRTVCSLALLGESWWLILERDGLGYPKSVEVLNPLWLEIKPDQNGKIQYLYHTDGQTAVVAIPKDRLVHIPFMQWPGSLRGMSSLDYMGVNYALALAALTFGEKFFSNGASPSYVLSTPSKLQKDEVTRIAERFLVEHSGLAQSHLPLVLDNGLKAEKIQSTPDEAQFIQTLASARATIAAFYGIPPHLMGSVSERGNAFATGATEEITKGFLQYTLSGYITPLEEVHSRLLPRGLKAAFDISKLHAPDPASLAAELTALRQTQVASVNDIRVRKLHWPPVDDPDADKVLAPLASNTAPAQTEPDADDPTTSKPEPPTE